MLAMLTYFKPSGKYYSEGRLEVPEGAEILKVWDMVEELMKTRSLPELRLGHSDYIVSVDCPEALHAHPRLIIPRNVQAPQP